MTQPALDFETANMLENIENYSDRELLEYIAVNMLTADRVLNAILENLPRALSQLDDSPTARMILRFMS